MMTNPQLFLKNELQNLAVAFPQINIKYGYCELIETHIIEMLPLSEFNNNEQLDAAWIPLSINFMEMFEHQEVAFISSDSSLSIKHIIFEFNPIKIKEECLIDKLFSEFAVQPLQYSFPTEIVISNLHGISNIILRTSTNPSVSNESSHSDNYLAAA